MATERPPRRKTAKAASSKWGGDEMPDDELEAAKEADEGREEEQEEEEQASMVFVAASTFGWRNLTVTGVSWGIAEDVFAKRTAEHDIHGIVGTYTNAKGEEVKYTHARTVGPKVKKPGLNTKGDARGYGDTIEARLAAKYKGPRMNHRVIKAADALRMVPHKIRERHETNLLAAGFDPMMGYSEAPGDDEAVEKWKKENDPNGEGETTKSLEQATGTTTAKKEDILEALKQTRTLGEWIETAKTQPSDMLSDEAEEKKPEITAEQLVELMLAAKNTEQRKYLSEMYRLKKGEDEEERQPNDPKKKKTEGVAADSAKEDNLRRREEQIRSRELQHLQREKTADIDDMDDSDDDRGRGRKRSRERRRSRKRRSRSSSSSSSSSSEEERGGADRECQFYQRGNCRFGDECTAKHSKPRAEKGGRGREDKKKSKSKKRRR
jgi:hypothetical protein